MPAGTRGRAEAAGKTISQNRDRQEPVPVFGRSETKRTADEKSAARCEVRRVAGAVQLEDVSIHEGDEVVPLILVGGVGGLPDLALLGLAALCGAPAAAARQDREQTRPGLQTRDVTKEPRWGLRKKQGA